MPDAEASWSLSWRWLHQKRWESLAGNSDPGIAIELETDALESMLASRPLVRIGRAVEQRSFAQRRRWECFLYHLMPQNTREAIKIPIARPAEMPIVTKSAELTILWSYWFRQWEHLARLKCCKLQSWNEHKHYVNIKKTFSTKKLSTWKLKLEITIYHQCNSVCIIFFFPSDSCQHLIVKG